MKKETILIAIAAFVFGCITGLIGPKLFSTTKSENVASHAPTRNSDKTPSNPEKNPEEFRRQLQHVLMEYKKVIKKDPRNFEANKALGNVYFELGRYEEAIEVYRTALEIEPGDGNVQVDMAICYRRINKIDIALQEMNKAIELNPDHAMAHFNKGVILRYDKEDYAGAKKEWETYLTLEPDSSKKDFAKEKLLEIEKLMKKTS